jgi:Na+/alanine symporter
MDNLFSLITDINNVLWHDTVLYVILAVGVLLILWSKFGPLVALTHGFAVIRGKFDDKDDPWQWRFPSAVPEPCSGCGWSASSAWLSR